MAANEPITQPPTWMICPRCGDVMAYVEGWLELVDREISIVELGCYGCGYVEGDFLEQEDEEQ